MMDKLLFLLMLLSASGMIFYLWLNARMQNQALHRLGPASSGCIGHVG